MLQLRDNILGRGGPDERLGFGVVLGEVAVDGGLKLDQQTEHAALEPTPGEPGEEGLDRVEPGGRGRGVVEGPAGMALKPGADLGVLVAAVTVEDHLDQLAGGHRRLDRAQEADELPVAVPGPAAAEHGAVQDIEGGEQRGGAWRTWSWVVAPALPGLGGRSGPWRPRRAAAAALQADHRPLADDGCDRA